jgi:hypothetical protein
MHNVTIISTVHKEMGKCNAEELCEIIVKINPEVIFLEALDNTYSTYEQFVFSQFEVYHKKLEIKAIQKYSSNRSFQYIPILDNELPDSFDTKYNVIGENIEFQKLFNNFNYLASVRGFQFLNSNESIRLQEEMRMLEIRLLKDSESNNIVSEDIDAYEKSMIRNIYSYCRNNQFNSAIFMCGIAHRKSIIDKTENFNPKEEISINWVIFEN